MKKTIFFYVILIQFSISFIITVLGVIGWVKISGGILTSLVSVLVLEQGAAVIGLFKNTDFFGSRSESNEEGWDLLATLWKFQKKCFGNDVSERWYLALSPQTPDFADFCLGYSSLHHLRLVHVGANKHEIALTDKGYQFCQKTEKKLEKRSRLFYLAND